MKLWQQVIIGLGSALLMGGMQRLTWEWVEYRHLILQLPAVLLAVGLGRGVAAGVSAVLVAVVLWLSYFRHLEVPTHLLAAQGWVDLIAFVGVGLLSAVFLGELWPKAIASKNELERLRFATLAAKVGIWEWDLRTGQAFWSPQMFQFYGLSPEGAEVTLDYWTRGVHPDDRERAAAEVMAASRGEKELDTQFRVQRPDGTIRYIRASAFLRRDSRGDPESLYGMNRDVTDEVRNLEQLQEVNAYFQAAMDQSQVGMVIVDAPSGKMRFCNPAALAIRGGSKAELVDGVNVNHYDPWKIATLAGVLIPSEETPLSRSILHGEKIRTEVGMINDQGELRIVLANTAPIRRPDGSIMAGISIFMDVTETHRVMEELERAKEAAEVASNAKSRFLDIAAHELRTPVTAFSLLLQLTQRQLDAGRPVEPSTLQRLRAQVDRLSRLVVDLLEVSRLDRGMLILKIERKDLGHLVAECVSNFSLQFPKRRFKLTGNGHRLDADFDSVRLYEVLSNLIDNAIKYTPDDRLIEVFLESTDEQIRLAVRDEGPGIAQERLALLFCPFERGDSNGQEQHAGLGLGLYICRKIIELHRGQLGVRSEPGAGSTFFFDFPRWAEKGSGAQVA